MPDTEEFVTPSWSNFQHDCVAELQLSGRSPVPQCLSAKTLPRGQTQVLDVCQIRQIDGHLAESGEDSAPDSISDSENWLDWNGDVDNSNNSKDNWDADTESEIQQENDFEETETLEKQNVSAAPNVPRLIWPTRRSKKNIHQVLKTVNTIEWRSTEGIEKT